MNGPTIAIIGSPWMRDANGARITTPAGTAHEAKARAAGEQLGRELARAGCRLLVYSAEPHSIEPDVVRGYVSVRKDRHCIEFRHPLGSGGVFPEQGLAEEPINDQADAANDWVVSFYRSLKDANGVLLLGGRNTVTIAGHVASAFERPVAAVATFKGAAAEVWRELKHVGGFTAEEHASMGREWTSSTAAAIVAALLRRHQANVQTAQIQKDRNAELERYQRLEDERKAGWPVLIMTGVSFLAVLVMVVSVLSGAKPGATFLSLFMATLTLAGVAGAGIRFLRAPAAYHRARSLLYGAVAGFVFSVLYLVPQWAGDTSLLTATEMSAGIRWQILLAAILALTGGLAADSVLAALQKSGETRTIELPQIAGSAERQNLSG